MPTAPEAPPTSTFTGLDPALVTKPCSAVSPATPTAAACSKVTFAGLRTIPRSSLTHVLGEGAVLATEDLVAGPDGRHALADGLDDPGEVHPSRGSFGGAGPPSDGRRTAGRTCCTSRHGSPTAARAPALRRRPARVSRVSPLEHVGRAVPLAHDGPHRGPPFSVRTTLPVFWPVSTYRDARRRPRAGTCGRSPAGSRPPRSAPAGGSDPPAGSARSSLALRLPSQRVGRIRKRQVPQVAEIADTYEASGFSARRPCGTSSCRPRRGRRERAAPRQSSRW